MSISRFIHPWAAAFFILLVLTSCESGRGSGSRRGPAFDAAVRQLTSQIEGVTVNSTWVEAVRHGSTSSVGSTITYMQCRYSGSRVTPDGVFHVHQTGKCWDDVHPADIRSFDSDVTKPMPKIGRVIVHNRSQSRELDAVINAEIWGKNGEKAPHFGDYYPQEKSLEENVTGSWTVELVANSGKKSSDYDRLFFPTRQKAESFAEAWRTLAAMLK